MKSILMDVSSWLVGMPFQLPSHGPVTGWDMAMIKSMGETTGGSVPFEVEYFLREVPQTSIIGWFTPFRKIAVRGVGM